MTIEQGTIAAKRNVAAVALWPEIAEIVAQISPTHAGSNKVACMPITALKFSLSAGVAGVSI